MVNMIGLVPIAGIVLISAVFLVFGGLFVAGGITDIRTASTLREISRQRAVDVGDGYAHIEGTARESNSTVTAPLSGRECLCYETKLQRKKVNQQRSGWHWDESHSKRGGGRFQVADSTGSVVVVPENADFELDVDWESLSESGEEPTGTVAAYVDDHDIYTFNDERIIKGQKVRLAEWRIEEGDSVSVIGPASTDRTDVSGTNAIIDQRGGFLHRFTSKPFALSDDDIDPTEKGVNGLGNLFFGALFLGAGVVAVVVFLRPMLGL